jgi:hypothetical protein
MRWLEFKSLGSREFKSMGKIGPMSQRPRQPPRSPLYTLVGDQPQPLGWGVPKGGSLWELYNTGAVLGMH